METWQNKISYVPDEEIARRAAGGETVLFEVLIRRYNSLLYKIARSYGFGHHDAEDLIQESHFAAFLSLTSFRNEASYKTWITKIHLHRCYQKLHSGYAKHVQVSDTTSSDAPIVRQPGRGSMVTENKVLNRELGRVLEESLQQLPLAYRSVFVLREMEGFSVADTAELLGITPVNVKVRFNRAKAMLQKQLETVYSTAELYEFHLMYCDKIVRNVFMRIAGENGS